MPGQFEERPLQRGRIAEARGWQVQRTSRCIVRCQQFQYPPTEFVVVGACPPNVGDPLLCRGHLHGREEHRFFGSGWIGHDRHLCVATNNAESRGKSPHGIQKKNRDHGARSAVSAIPRQLSVQPGTCVSPMAISGCGRNAEALRRLRNGQSSEIAKLDQLGLFGIAAFEPLERLIQS